MTTQPQKLQWLSGGGAMADVITSIDWSTSPLGPIEDWPQSLRTTVSLCLASNFPINIIWGDQHTQIYNDGYRVLCGAVHPRAMGEDYRVTWESAWPAIGEPFERALAGETSYLENQRMFLERNGYQEETFFTFSLSPIRDESGKVVGLFHPVTETTTMMLGERRTRVLREIGDRAGTATSFDQACTALVATLAEHPFDVPFALLYLTSADGRIAKLHGAAAPSVLSKETLALDAPNGWPLTEAARQVRGLRVADMLARFGAVAAGSYPEPVTTAFVLPIRVGGEPLGYLVVGASPRLPLDSRYESFFEMLGASASAALGAAHAHERERQRADELATLDRAKIAFFNNVSHELRTPLTLILAPAEDALAAGSLTAEEQERWSIVRRSALRLTKMVNTLLDFSRIEAGRVEASYEPTDLSALTGELASMFRSAIDRGGLSLRLELPDLGEPAYVDREMWEKLILNLLSNALKFTFEGEIAVSLRLDEGAIELRVRDTGIGIAASELAHVFDRFHRVKGARARTHEGTGIGLALVAELARLHGGQVQVESVEGRGAVFVVRIPRGRAHLPADRIGAPRAQQSTATGPSPYVEEALRWSSIAFEQGRESVLPLPTTGGPRARIVVADDNADMRDYLARLLGERWDVEAVSDGESALAAIRRAPADLVLSDVMMPGLNGFELLRGIREDRALRLTPVILLSARAGEEATTEGLSAGANDYIVKPFSARELLVRVASQLAVSAVAREAHAIEEAARTRLYGHFMQAPFPISVLRGSELHIELANPAMLTSWGKDASVVGKPILDASPELAGQPIVGPLHEVFRTGLPHTARGERTSLIPTAGPPAEDQYFDLVYAPLREQDGTVDGVLVAAFDVTAQARAAQELTRLLASAEANERHIREVVENLPDLAWTARADGFVDYFNRRWYDYTATTPEATEGWGWKTVHDPAQIDAVVAAWQRSLETGEPFEMELALRGGDGVFRWFLTRARPLRDASGRIVRWFGSNTNIDERRKEAAFKEMFLAIVGHDLRGPLTTILATSQLLGRHEESFEIKQNLQRISRSGGRMQRMIDQLLDMTRARLAGGIPVVLSATEVRLAPIVAKILDEVRGASPNARIELQVEGDPAACIDEDRFEQVVSNLIGNAMAHGDGTPVYLALGGNAGGVSLSVENRGEPIAAALMPSIFDPFARAVRTRGRAAGLGLGLYISERIVDAHRGTLTVESSVEAGTRFEVRLPRLS